MTDFDEDDSQLGYGGYDNIRLFNGRVTAKGSDTVQIRRRKRVRAAHRKRVKALTEGTHRKSLEFDVLMTVGTNVIRIYQLSQSEIRQFAQRFGCPLDELPYAKRRDFLRDFEKFARGVEAARNE